MQSAWCRQSRKIEEEKVLPDEFFAHSFAQKSHLFDFFQQLLDTKCAKHTQFSNKNNVTLATGRFQKVLNDFRSVKQNYNEVGVFLKRKTE